MSEKKTTAYGCRNLLSGYSSGRSEPEGSTVNAVKQRARASVEKG